MVLALHEARVDAANISAMYTVVLDALTRRLLELRGRRSARGAAVVRVARAGQPGAPRDDSGLRRGQRDRWFGADGDAAIGRVPAGASARSVVAGLEACGLRARRPGCDRLLARSSCARWSPGSERCGSWLARAAPGAGADPHLRVPRQPPGVGRPHGDAARRHVPRGARATKRCCACWRASPSPTGRPPGSCAGSSSSTPASTAAASTSSAAACCRSSTSRAGRAWRPASRAPPRESACAPPPQAGTLVRAGRADARGRLRPDRRAASRAPRAPAARRRAARRPPRSRRAQRRSPAATSRRRSGRSRRVQKRVGAELSLGVAVRRRARAGAGGGRLRGRARRRRRGRRGARRAGARSTSS